MIQSVEMLDGALGYTPSDQPYYVIGPAKSGSTTQIEDFGSPDTLYSVHEEGKLPDRIARLFSRGIGPVSALRCAASTPGAILQPVKTPATKSGTPATLLGAIRVAGATAPGNVLYQAKLPGISLIVLNNGMANQVLLASRSGNVVTIRVATDGANATTTTGSQLAAYSLPAEVAAAISLTALGDGSGVIGTLASTPFDKGGLVLTPKAQWVRYKTVASGANTSLAVAVADGTDDLGNASKDVTITLGTDANSQPDPTKNTATLVKAAIDGSLTVAPLLDASLLGDGTGHLGQRTTFAALTFGSTGWIAVSGTPADHYDLAVKINSSGGLDVGEYQLGKDEARTYGSIAKIPSAGTYAIPGTGLTLTFSGTFDAGDLFTCLTTGPTSTGGDISAALAVFSGLTGDGGEIHLVGQITGSIAAMIATWIGTERTAGRDWIVYTETRDYSSPTETNTAYKASLRSDFDSVTEPDGALVIFPGWWSHVIPIKGTQRRPFAWACVEQVWAVGKDNIANHPSSKQDGGGVLQGLFTPKTPTAPRTHDERLSPGLGGSAGRFATVQSGSQLGEWLIGDAGGKRSPGTRAAGTSDWSLLMHARIGSQARRAARRKGQDFFARRGTTKRDGTLIDSVRKTWEGELESGIKEALGAAVVGVRTVIDPTTNFKAGKFFIPTHYLDLEGYVLEVKHRIGQEPVVRTQ